MVESGYLHVYVVVLGECEDVAVLDRVSRMRFREVVDDNRRLGELPDALGDAVRISRVDV
jgi:hypothetical protein